MVYFGIEFTPSGDFRLGSARCNLHRFATEAERDDWLDYAWARVKPDDWANGWRSPVTPNTLLRKGARQYQVRGLECLPS